ncbi:MAG: TraX family protein [Lachnospiraceae bacterium]|nr:TraX family protein [Lachnospiraceae bacterium]MDY5742881.1 TraX family protein [Lachnospiraceae bacterium]
MQKITFNSRRLKWLAMITMTIDHIGAFILEPLIPAAAYISLPATIFDLTAIAPSWRPIYGLMLLTRLIGRLAFPVFCFLLVQGFYHSRLPAAYALRLLIFALISEPFFDLANSDRFWNPSGQNVFFTLFFGLVLLMILHLNKLPAGLRLIGALLPVLAVRLIDCDYGLYGLGLMVLFGCMTAEPPHLLTNNFLPRMWLCFYLFYQFTACFALPILSRYNGERGKRQGLGFYLYYPLHLLLFWALTGYLLGR